MKNLNITEHFKNILNSDKGKKTLKLVMVAGTVAVIATSFAGCQGDAFVEETTTAITTEATTEEIKNLVYDFKFNAHDSFEEVQYYDWNNAIELLQQDPEYIGVISLMNERTDGKYRAYELVKVGEDLFKLSDCNGFCNDEVMNIVSIQRLSEMTSCLYEKTEDEENINFNYYILNHNTGKITKLDDDIKYIMSVNDDFYYTIKEDNLYDTLYYTDGTKALNNKYRNISGNDKFLFLATDKGTEVVDLSTMKAHMYAGKRVVKVLSDEYVVTSDEDYKDGVARFTSIYKSFEEVIPNQYVTINIYNKEHNTFLCSDLGTGQSAVIKNEKNEEVSDVYDEIEYVGFSQEAVHGYAKKGNTRYLLNEYGKVEFSYENEGDYADMEIYGMASPNQIICSDSKHKKFGLLNEEGNIIYPLGYTNFRMDTLDDEKFLAFENDVTKEAILLDSENNVLLEGTSCKEVFDSYIEQQGLVKLYQK